VRQWRAAVFDDTSVKSTHGRPALVPSGGGLAADIRGVDLRWLEDDAFADNAHHLLPPASFAAAGLG
jgi:hypothetical protein